MVLIFMDVLNYKVKYLFRLSGKNDQINEFFGISLVKDLNLIVNDQRYNVKKHFSFMFTILSLSFAFFRTLKIIGTMLLMNPLKIRKDSTKNGMRFPAISIKFRDLNHLSMKRNLFKVWNLSTSMLKI